MKKNILRLIMMLMSVMIILNACEENPDTDIAPDDNPQNEDPDGSNSTGDDQLDANALTGSIRFMNGNILSGQIPPVSRREDFKLDTDTIFWVEGIKKRIRLRYPETFTGHVTSVLLQVKNADSYIELEPEEAESNDTISVFYFDFDPADWEVPLSFNMDIAVKDEAGEILDDFPGRPVEIEKPGDFDCSPVGDRWDWLYTTVHAILNRAEGYPQITPGTVKGCFDSGVSYYGNCIGSTLEGTVDYEAFAMQDFEYVKFFAEGDLVGELHEIYRNIDPTISDFCNNAAGYSDRRIHNVFSGNFSFDENTGRISLTNMDGQSEKVVIGQLEYELPLPLYFGNFNHVEMISCHFMVDRSNVEGIGMERVFERRSASFEWHD